MRLIFFVEGQTEQAYVARMLSPHLANFGVYVDRAILPITGRRRGTVFKGGGRSFAKGLRQFENLLKEHDQSDVRFTTMFDLYGLYSDFPGQSDAESLRNDARTRVQVLERAFFDQFNDRRIIPHIQLHEFETILLAGPEELAFFDEMADARISELQAAVAEAGNVELVNDGVETAPSKRIERCYSSYHGAQDDRWRRVGMLRRPGEDPRKVCILMLGFARWRVCVRREPRDRHNSLLVHSASCVKGVAVFVDRVEIFVKAGDGGRGMASFRREKYVPKGGPDGGDGGDGGSIIIRAVSNADNLATIAHQKHYKAKSGEPGGFVPVQRQDGEGSLFGGAARDHCSRPGSRTCPQGLDRDRPTGDGRQGWSRWPGNKYFATSTNRAPRKFEPGGEGEERWISLELKVIADVGLVGLPNAGKSTLLSRLSRARPEIADYPFTTKYPNLGMVSVGGDHHFVMADLPGLIEGAHSGVGLGHEFLRHVERTRIIVHLVEPFPTDGSDPLQNYRTIRNELELYSPALARKPEFVAVSKSELTESAEVRERMARELGIEVESISAVTGQGLAKLMSKVVVGLAAIPREKPPAESDFTKPKPEPVATADPGN